MSQPGPATRDEFFDSLLGDFLDESGQLLDRLNENLLQLDEWVRQLDDARSQPCSEELLNDMFRSAHSLKGLSAMLGLSDINNLTHKVENIFDAARKNQLTVDGDVVELIFAAVDCLVSLVDALRDPQAGPVECEPVAARIRCLLQSAGAERRQCSQADAERALQEQAEVDYFADLSDETESPSKYLSVFIDETEISLDELTEALLAIEKGPSPEAIQTLQITFHRIKGSAASIGLRRPAKLAHLMEDLLQNLIEGRRQLTPPITDALLTCTDALRQYVEGLKHGDPQSAQFNQLAHRLLAAQAAETSTPSAAPAPLPVAAMSNLPAQGGQDESRGSISISDELRAQVAGLSGDHDATLVGRVVFQPALPLVGLKARLVYQKLSNLGDFCYFHPPAESLDDLETLDSVCFGLITEQPPEEVRRKLGFAGVQEAAVERLVSGQAACGPAAAPPAGTAAEPKGQSAEGANRPTETLRVDIERLDQLMNLAGQLVINKARFSQIGDRLKKGLERVGRDADALPRLRGSVAELFEIIHQLELVSDEIQQNVMDTRMLPIGPLFARFKRVIRDITRSNGKIINLVISGEKTELDKRMIDELGDPLIHMVRNAADHGIELPEVRQAAGKPPQGTITLDACHRGNSIVIRVTDDGKGLDADRIARKALEKGLITAADLEKMTPREIYQLIWAPGLSTAEKVTEVSGRGMGMDIVKSKIESLNGTAELDSEPGQGTRLAIKLPLTLAILPSLMVEIEGDVFALPLESVVEIVSLRAQDLTTVHGRWVGRIRDRFISTVMLREVFDWTAGAARQERDTHETTVVVVGEGGRQIGLLVDRVRGEEDVVIKSIADNYRNVPGIAGASILGDGRVSLIIDLAALIDMASRARAAQPVSQENQP